MVEWNWDDLVVIRKVKGPVPPPRFSRQKLGGAWLLGVVPRVGRYLVGPSAHLWVRPLYYTGTSWMTLQVGPLLVRTRERSDHARGVREDLARRRVR